MDIFGRRIQLLCLYWHLIAAELPDIAYDSPIVTQVHVITRHGARTPLPKNPDSLQEKAGSTLTPKGQKQMYDLGVWLRDKYHVDGFLDQYDASHIRLESSNLDRTLTSASALSLGLFPHEAQAGVHADDYGDLPRLPSLPVYSRSETNDIYLRTYQEDVCPAFNEKLQALYTTTAWVAMESSNRQLLTTLGQLFPEKAVEGKMELKNIWTVYDRIHVARTECIPDDSSQSCQMLDDPSLKSALSDSDFASLESLVGKTEALKYGPETAGSMLGSNLLWRILTRVNNQNRRSAQDPTTFKFFLYSAHAPTLLGFMSALDTTSEIEEEFPDYGSAIIVESRYHASTNDWLLRFLYKKSDSDTVKYIPIPQANCRQVHNAYNEKRTKKTMVEHCETSRFLEWATSNTISSQAEWCSVCNNDSADVCMEEKLHSGHHDPMSNLGDIFTGNDDDDVEGAMLAVTFVGGLVVGMLLVMVFSCAGRCCRGEGKEGSRDLDCAASHTEQSEDLHLQEFVEPPRPIS